MGSADQRRWPCDQVVSPFVRCDRAAEHDEQLLGGVIGSDESKRYGSQYMRHADGPIGVPEPGQHFVGISFEVLGADLVEARIRIAIQQARKQQGIFIAWGLSPNGKCANLMRFV